MDGWTIGRLKTYTAYKEESELKSGLFSSKTINCHYSIFNPARLNIWKKKDPWYKKHNHRACLFIVAFSRDVFRMAELLVLKPVSPHPLGGQAAYDSPYLAKANGRTVSRSIQMKSMSHRCLNTRLCMFYKSWYPQIMPAISDSCGLLFFSLTPNSALCIYF